MQIKSGKYIQAILISLSNPDMKSKEIANTIRWTIANTRRTLILLVKEGLVENSGSEKNERWRVINKKAD